MLPKPEAVTDRGGRSWRTFPRCRGRDGTLRRYHGVTIVILLWLVLLRTGSAPAAHRQRTGRRCSSRHDSCSHHDCGPAVWQIVNKVGRRRVPVASDPMGLFNVALTHIVDLAFGLECGLLAVLAVWGGTYVVGLALGGVLILLSGAAPTLWITAVIFRGSAAVIAGIRILTMASPSI
jgi:hypothetical protein